MLSTFLTTPLLENPICVFSFSRPHFLHRNCLPKHCTKNNGSICLTERMQGYLQSKYKIYESKGFQKKYSHKKKENDWTYIEDALKTTKEPFSNLVFEEAQKTPCHRLRMKKHSELGIALINKLIDKLRSFCRDYGAIWGTECPFQQIKSYCKLFERLCGEADSQSIGEIYRLYDLTEGTTYHMNRHPTFFPLCLLFAFGHGMPHSPLKSISEFVAKFQFFQIFAQDVLDQLGWSVLKNEQCLKQLASERFGEIACKLWEGHLIATSLTRCTELIHNTQLLKAIEEHMCDGRQELPKSLQIQIKSNLMIPLRHVTMHTTPLICSSHDYQLKSKMGFQLLRAQKGVGFNSDFNTAYHTFKHKEVVNIFFRRPPSKVIPITEYASWSLEDCIDHAKKAMRDYMHVINEMMEESRQISARPTQFDQGTIFTFECERQIKDKKRMIRVHATGYQNGVSFVLTGF